MNYLGPVVAWSLGALGVHQRGGSRHLRLEGCRGTASELKARCARGIPAQRPLNAGEAPRVLIFDLGTPTCFIAGLRSELPKSCPTCGVSRSGGWVVRPCGHAVCGYCVLHSHSCAVCGNRDLGESKSDAIVGYEVVDRQTTIFHRADGSTKAHTNDREGRAEQLVQILASYCDGNDAQAVLSMLTATAAFCLGPTALSEADECDVVYLAVKGAPDLAIAQLVHAVRQDYFDDRWWHNKASCIVRLFLNVGSFKGQAIARENVGRALGYWKQRKYAEENCAAVKIQACFRGWLVRRSDTRAALRNAAAVKIQALWEGFSRRRVCTICLEMGARNMRCGCRGAQAYAHADCLVEMARSTGNWDFCPICHQRRTGKVGLWIAGCAHEESRKLGILENPETILRLSSLLVEQDRGLDGALQSLNSLGLALSRTEPSVLGGRTRHQEYVVRVQIQIALAEYHLDDLEAAASRLKSTLLACANLLGLDHPQSLRVQMYLARINFASGQVAVARDILVPLVEELGDTFGTRSEEFLHHGAMVVAAIALVEGGKGSDRARLFFFESFEILRRTFGPAHHLTLEWIRWRQCKRVGVAFTTAAQIKKEAATKIQALWRGWAYRRPCDLCKNLGAAQETPAHGGSAAHARHTFVGPL
jgi:hypothetical protein